MQALIVLTLSFGLLWVLFLLPQKRQVRAHRQLVAELDEGDDVLLSAGIYGRITRLGTDDLDVEVAPGVELRVARQAVLRRVEPGEHADATHGHDNHDNHDDLDSSDGHDNLDKDEMPGPPAGDRF